MRLDAHNAPVRRCGELHAPYPRRNIAFVTIALQHAFPTQGHSTTPDSERENKLNKTRRPFYKFWPVWVVVLVLVGWPYVNDWAWHSAKEDAKYQIGQFEIKFQAQAKAPAGAAPAAPVSIEMSRLTCVAANSYFAPYWQLNTPYRARLIQSFLWHGYGMEVPSAKSIKERGCGETEDGKYIFTGT